MRKYSGSSFATTCTQWQRVTNGKVWNNPEYATAAHGYVGTTISNLNGGITNGNLPFGPDYLWCPGSDPVAFTAQFPTQSTWNPNEPDAANKYPNALRFSGFNIAGAGIDGADIVTRLLINIQYKNETIGSGFGSAAGGILLTPTKNSNVRLQRGRSKVFSKPDTNPAPVTNYFVNIACVKDDAHMNDTYFAGIAPNVQQRWQQGYYYGEVDPQSYFAASANAMYYEPTNTIVGLTIAEINNAGFFIDAAYVHNGATSSTITILNMSIQVEYIKAYSDSITIAPIQYQVRNVPSGIPGPVQSWDVPPRAETFNAVYLDAYSDGAGPNPFTGNLTNGPDPHTASINAYYSPYGMGIFPGNVSDPITPFASELLISRAPVVTAVNELAVDIADIIMDIRWNPAYRGLQNYAQEAGRYERYRWTVFLMDGYPASVAATYGQPIWKYQIQAYPPGFDATWNYANPGGWPIVGAARLDSTGEPQPYHTEGDFIMQHIPIRTEVGSSFGAQLTNQINFPGTVYDPTWLEVALNAGTLFYGIVLQVQPGDSSYWNTNPYPQRWLKVDSMNLRVKYGLAGAPPPPGATSAGLLIRQTP